MRKSVTGFLSAVLLSSVPAVAQEIQPEAQPVYNCDFQPSCEVAPGAYGKMHSVSISKFNLSIGGFAKLDYAYNSVNLGSAVPAIGTLQPRVPKSSSVAGQQDQSVFTARQSRFWLKIAGPTFLGAKTSALLESDFYGSGGTNESPTLRLRHAYGTLDWANTQLLFGQTWDIFSGGIASTVDFGGGATFGNPGQPRVSQIRLTQRVNLDDTNALKLVLGVQNPTQNANLQTNSNGDSWGGKVNVAGQAMLVSKALGVAPGFYGLSMNSLTAGFFGIYGNQEVAGNNHTVDSYGYGFYTFVPVLKSADGRNRAMTASFEGHAYMASNLANVYATAGSLVGPAGDKTGAKGYGLFAQTIFYPTQDLGFTAGFGKRNAYNYASYVNSGIKDFEKSNTHLFFNVAYDLNAAIRVAAEYQNLNTQYGNNTPGSSGTGTANIGRMALYYFF